MLTSLAATSLTATSIATSASARGLEGSAPPSSTADPEAVPIATASDQTLGYPGLTVIATDTGFVLPDGITAGRYFMTTQNAGTFWSHFFTLRVPEDVTDDELAAALQSDEDAEWTFDADVVGNSDQTLPGKETHAVVDLAEGRYILVDPIRGNVGRFDVGPSEETEAPADPHSDVSVEMREMQFAGMPETVPAGPTVWRITNGGTLWHEAVVMHVPDGSTVDSLLDQAASESASDGPDDAFFDAVEAGSAVVSPGNTMWMVLDLEPGTYAVICTFPNDDGTLHVMDGMLSVFTVGES